MAAYEGYRPVGVTDEGDFPERVQKRLREKVISDEIDERNLISDSEIVEDGVAFSYTDEDGRRSWLEIDPDGGPTDHSVELLTPKIVTPVLEEASSTGVVLAVFSDDISGITYAVVDEDGRRSWLEIGLDGGPTDRVIEIIENRLSVQLDIPQFSGPDVVIVGHSMSSQVSSYVATQMGTLGRSSVNLGVGGESMSTISSRWGSHPTYILPVGLQIPESGPVQITLNSDSATPLLQGPSTYNVTVILADGTTIPGVFGKDANGFTFTRSSTGSVVSVTRPVRMRYDIAESNRSRLPLFWAGRNGSWTAANAVRERLDRMQGMIDHINALDRRFLVLSEHIASTDPADVIAAIRDYNRQAYLRWGRRFIDTQQYLVDYGLEDASLPETAQDTLDRQAGITPTSLRGDNIHLNASGNTVVAALVKRQILENGW